MIQWLRWIGVNGRRWADLAGHFMQLLKLCFAQFQLAGVYAPLQYARCMQQLFSDLLVGCKKGLGFLQSQIESDALQGCSWWAHGGNIVIAINNRPSPNQCPQLIMLDVNPVCSAFGWPPIDGTGEQLILPGQIRLIIDAQGWMLIFENSRTDLDTVQHAFACTQSSPDLIPMLTRSDRLAMRWIAPGLSNDTDMAIDRLRHVLAFA